MSSSGSAAPATPGAALCRLSSIFGGAHSYESSGVRVNFYAPVGSGFGVSLRDLSGTSVATLTENTGTPAPPEAGYFQIFDVRRSGSQAIYRITCVHRYR